MRVTIALLAFTACVVAVVAGLVLFASTVPIGACTGVVYDASVCESLRLRQSLLAAILIGSAFISASVIIGALLISAGTVRGRPTPTEAPPTD